MTDGLQFKIEGVDVINRNLKDMEQEVRQKHADRAVGGAARMIRDEIEIGASRKFRRYATGNLANSVVARKMRKRYRQALSRGKPGTFFGYEVGFLGQAFYWYFWEYGHHPGRYGIREYALGARASRRQARRSTGRNFQIRPFARPAFERKKAAAFEYIVDELARPIKKPRRQR